MNENDQPPDASVIRGPDRHRDKRGLLHPAFCLILSPGEANVITFAKAHDKNPYQPGNPGKLPIKCPVIADGRLLAMADCELIIKLLYNQPPPSLTGL